MSNSEQKVEIVPSLKDFPFKTLLVIGKTGTGKSTLCNRLAGFEADADLFPVSEGAVSCTQTTKMGIINLGEKGNMVSLIDTIGFDDPDNDTDVKIIAELVSQLKYNCDHVNLFAIVVNGQSPRLDGSLISMIKVFEDMFTEQFWKQCVLIFTRLPMDKKSIKRRQGNNKGRSDQDIAKDYLNVVEQRFKKGKGLQYLFMDACYDKDDDDEVSAFKQAFGCLDVMITDAGRLYTSLVNEKVETEHKKLKNEMEKQKMEAEKQMMEVEKQRMEVEKQRVEVEKQRMKAEKQIANVEADFQRKMDLNEAQKNNMEANYQRQLSEAKKIGDRLQRKMEIRDLFRFEASSHGNIPPQAVLGLSGCQDEEIFVGRAEHEGSLVPGKVHPSHSCLYLSYGGDEIRKEYYQVLVQDGNVDNTHWVDASDGDRPEGAIKIGHESNGDPLFIARGQVDGGGWALGKLNPKYGYCHLPYGCKEHCVEQYQVLCMNSVIDMD